MTPSSPSKSHRSRTADLLIIGAGVIGAAIAASAVRRGLSVTVVDRGAIPGFGSTSSSAGIARVHAGDVESSILADESITAWERWRELTEVPEGDAAVRFERCGTYILDDGSGMTDHVMKVMDAAGVAFSELDGDQLEEALPWADTRRFGGPCRPEDPQFWGAPEGRIERAVHTPSSGYVADPALAAQNLAAYAKAWGSVSNG